MLCLVALAAISSIITAELLKKRQLSIIFAAIVTILGTVFTFLVNDINFLRSNALWLASTSEKIGINRILRAGNPYSDTSYQRKSLWDGHEYISRSEVGFKFARNIIEKTYYKKLEKKILLLTQPLF